MQPDLEITAKQILAAGMSVTSRDLQPDSNIPTVSAVEIFHTLRDRFAKAPDAGIRRRLSNVVLEPANPFELKSRRPVRQETVIIGVLVSALIGLAAYFNLTAP